MDLDIRKSIIEKIKNDDEKAIIDTINESVVTSDELVLPGLGVMLELFWNKLNYKEKMNIANIIKNSISDKNLSWILIKKSIHFDLYRFFIVFIFLDSYISCFWVTTIYFFTIYIFISFYFVICFWTFFKSVFCC